MKLDGKAARALTRYVADDFVISQNSAVEPARINKIYTGDLIFQHSRPLTVSPGVQACFESLTSRRRGRDVPVITLSGTTCHGGDKERQCQCISDSAS